MSKSVTTRPVVRDADRPEDVSNDAGLDVLVVRGALDVHLGTRVELEEVRAPVGRDEEVGAQELERRVGVERRVLRHPGVAHGLHGPERRVEVDAAGDALETFHVVRERVVYVALAGHAQARVVDALLFR